MDLDKNLSITKIDDFSHLLTIKDQWNVALHRSDSDNPFLTFEWLSSWWSHFSDGGKLFVLIAKDEDRIIAIAPLMIIRKGIFRVLQFIGTGRSDYLDFMIAEKRQESLQSIFRYIHDAKKYWDIMYFRDISSDSQNLEFIKSAIGHTGMASGEIVGTMAPYMPKNGNWDNYLASKSSKFRNNMRRIEKKLEKAGEFRITCKNTVTSEDVDAMHKIEERSWKTDAGSPRLGNQKACKFFTEVLEKFSNNSWLDLWFLCLNQEPIAYSVNFAYRNKIFNYNVAYVSEHRNLYPGKALTVKTLEDAFNRNMTEYDFLRGNEAYKSDWTSQKRDLYYLAAYRKSLYSMMAYMLIIKLRWLLKEYRFAHRLNVFRVKCIHNLKKIAQLIHPRSIQGERE